MEFGVLGQLEAWRDGERLSLGPVKQRSLLALLLINANRAVSTDQLIDELWSDEPSADRHNALWIQVSKLRSTLEPDRAPRSDGTVLITRPPGYFLQVAPDEVDARRFELLVQEARGAAEADPGLASLVLSEALALWRGRAYEDFIYESFAQTEIARLEELRLEAVELRLDCDLRCGLAHELVAELQSLVRQYPLREQLSAQLMLALYRSGRQADALQAYGNLRSRLAEELGLDPSSVLQRLEQQVICADRELDVHPAALSQPARLAVRGYELRERIGTNRLGQTYRAYQPAVGREVALTVVKPELVNDVAFIRRFQADAEVATTFQHPHFVAVEDLWREPGGAYVVTRLVSGHSVEVALRNGPLSIDTAVTIVGDVASALAVAHQRGYVHGGLDTRSVLVENGRGFVAGYGYVPTGTRARREASDEGDPLFDAPEQTAGGAVTPSTDVYRLGRLLERMLRPEEVSGQGERPDAVPAGMSRLISHTTALQPGDRPANATAFLTALREFADAQAAPIAPVALAEEIDNPYKGLQAFGEVDAADFFGRERVVERLLARLGAGGSFGRFVAVVGPSGSGKSSVVRAGLLPAIRAGGLTGSADWFVVEMTPGRRPFEALATGLESIALERPTGLLGPLNSGSAGVRHVLDDILPSDQSQVLVVIDQFEELFTHASSTTARPFLESLTEAVLSRRSRLRLVITLRADFYDRPLSNHAFAELLRRGTEVIGAMSPEELQQAIERPTDRVGVHYAPGLVAQIVTDVADHAAALPLLQFALTELFDHRRGRTIDLATYHELGGAAGALAQRADDVYDTLSPAAHETTRQVMLRLVHVGDGDDDVTRRRILLQELVGLDDERVTEVVDALAAERLLAFDRDPVTRSPTVEISHEALFSEWTRLRIWIAEARDDVRRHHRLAQAAQEWRTASESSDYLLGGARLDEALGLADRSDIRLTPPERSFLDASIEHREAERTAERAQRTREMRLRRKSRRRAGVLIGSAIALIAVTTVALTQRAHSRAAARVTAASAEAHRLAVASASVADKQPDLAILLALQSLSTSEHEHLAAASGAEDALHWAIQGAGLTYPTANAPIDVRTGPNGLTGVFRLPLADLVGLARRHLTRGFTSAECAHYSLHPCPSGTHGLASPARFGQAPIPSSVPETGRVRTGTPLAGTTVTVLEDPGDSRRFTSELQAFESATGISVDEVESEPVNAPLVDRLPKGGRPDITLSYSPGVLRDLAARGQLVDLATYLDRSSLQTDVGDEFTTIATVGSGLYFLPMAFDLKGLVWYPVGAFRQAGYQVPHTMDELVALAKRMAAAGQSPWCLGNGQGAASGWTVTDWLEAMVLRVGGPQRYDGWTTHEVPFDDPGIEQAGALLNRALFEPGFIHGAPTWPVQRDPGYAVQELGLHPPECLMVEGASFLGAGVTGLGKDLDYFTLPPIGRGTAPVALGGDVMAAAMHDRPEVRELMRYIAGPSWGHVAMSQPNISFIPARTNFDIVDCVDHSASLAANGVRVRLCQDARAALQSGRWRFDASDEMPVAIGGVDESGKPGAFLTGMLDYVAQGPSSLNGILTRIERAWPPA